VRTSRKFIRVILILAISIGIFFAYLSTANFDEFPSMLDGTAVRPAAYRILLPTLAEASRNLVPAQMVARFEAAPRGTVLVEAFHNLGGGTYPAQAIVVLVLILTSLIGFVFVEKKLLQELGYRPEEQAVLPLVIAVFTVPLSIYFSYFYDLPQVFLFALSLLFLYRRDWLAYMITLAVALLNKETSILAVVVFGVYYFSRLPRRNYLLLLGVQLGIFIAVRSFISSMVSDQPGQPIFWTIKDHIQQYTKYPSTFIFTLVFLGIILFLVFRNWQAKPVFLRSASAVFVLMLILFFAAGMPMEFRVFLDVLPVFGVLLFPHRKAAGSTEEQGEKQLSTLHVQ